MSMFDGGRKLNLPARGGLSVRDTRPSHRGRRGQLDQSASAFTLLGVRLERQSVQRTRAGAVCRAGR